MKTKNSLLTTQSFKTSINMEYILNYVILWIN